MTDNPAKDRQNDDKAEPQQVAADQQESAIPETPDEDTDAPHEGGHE